MFRWGLANQECTGRATPPRPRVGTPATAPWDAGAIARARAAETGFGARDSGANSLKRCALTSGNERGVRQADLKRPSRLKSIEALVKYLQFDDPFERHLFGDVP
jgi:hypothetical protein